MGKYFGTDGFRGVANKNLKASLAFKIGRFIGHSETNQPKKILIARDTRLSGEMLNNAIASGIMSSGGDVYDLGVSTTPSVSYLVIKHHFDYGVMISASHNPYYDNGIKIFNSNGEKLEENIENEIEKYLDSFEDDIPFALNENIGKRPDSKDLVNEYIDYLASKANFKFNNLKVLIDCSNGSASAIIKSLLDKIHLKADLVNVSPNGININDRCGSTHIQNLSDIVTSKHYDVAFAFDGDADRLLMMDHKGHIVDGDAIIFLNALFMKKNGKLHNNKVVLTVMSNIGLKKALDKFDVGYSIVNVGDKYVQADMKKNNYSLGGEQSGHIIFLDDMNTGDGLLTMIKVLDVMASEGKSIEELVKDLVIYPQVLKNTIVTNKEAVLSHKGFLSHIKELEETLHGDGRILVRASGTEPLIRVMCEASSLEICNKICNDLIEYISELQ